MLNFYLFFRIDIRILVLVRDPRATMHSRLELEFTLEALYFFTLSFFEKRIHSPLAKNTFFLKIRYQISIDFSGGFNFLIRQSLEWCQKSEDCSDSSVLCNDMVSDHSAILHMQQKYPEKIRYYH